MHSGGLTLDAGNRSNLVDLVNTCLRQIGPYYRLSFVPKVEAKTEAFHSLKVVVDKPGLTARTNSGYYGEP